MIYFKFGETRILCNLFNKKILFDIYKHLSVGSYDLTIDPSYSCLYILCITKLLA